MNTIRYVGDV